jgi:hypothetical protein
MSAPIDNLNNRPNNGPARTGRKIPGRPLKIGIGGGAFQIHLEE